MTIYLVCSVAFDGYFCAISRLVKVKNLYCMHTLSVSMVWLTITCCHVIKFFSVPKLPFLSTALYYEFCPEVDHVQIVIQCLATTVNSERRFYVVTIRQFICSIAFLIINQHSCSNYAGNILRASPIIERSCWLGNYKSFGKLSADLYDRQPRICFTNVLM